MTVSGTSTPPRNLQQEIGKAEPFGQPEQEAYLNLVRTHAMFAREFAALFKLHGLSDPQYNALRIIGAAGKAGIKSETVGERMIAQDPDTTRLIDRLQKAGLVVRERSAEDRRCVFITITADGSQLLRRLSRKVKQLHTQQLGHMTTQQLKQFNALLFAARQR